MGHAEGDCLTLRLLPQRGFSSFYLRNSYQFIQETETKPRINPCRKRRSKFCFSVLSVKGLGFLGFLDLTSTSGMNVSTWYLKVTLETQTSYSDAKKLPKYLTSDLPTSQYNCWRQWTPGCRVWPT